MGCTTHFWGGGEQMIGDSSVAPPPHGGHGSALCSVLRPGSRAAAASRLLLNLGPGPAPASVCGNPSALHFLLRPLELWDRHLFGCYLEACHWVLPQLPHPVAPCLAHYTSSVAARSIVPCHQGHWPSRACTSSLSVMAVVLRCDLSADTFGCPH